MMILFSKILFYLYLLFFLCYFLLRQLRRVVMSANVLLMFFLSLRMFCYLFYILYFGYIIEMKDFVHMKGLRAEHMCKVLLQALLF